MKRANDLEDQGYEFIDIQVDTYVSFLSGFAKKGIQIVKEEITSSSGGISGRTKRKTIKTKQNIISTKKVFDTTMKEPNIGTKKSLGFATGAFLSFL